MSLYEVLGRDDPTPWLLDAEEPQARWLALKHLTGGSDTQLAEVHAEVVAHPALRAAPRGVRRSGATYAARARVPLLLARERLPNQEIGGSTCCPRS